MADQPDLDQAMTRFRAAQEKAGARLVSIAEAQNKHLQTATDALNSAADELEKAAA